MGKLKAALGKLLMGGREIEVHDIEIETHDPELEQSSDGFTGFASGSVETTIEIDTMRPEVAIDTSEEQTEAALDPKRLEDWKQAAKAMQAKDPHLSAIMASRMGKAAALGSAGVGPSDALRAAAQATQALGNAVAAAAGAWTPESGAMPDVATLSAIAAATGQSVADVARACEIAVRACMKPPSPGHLGFRIPALPALPIPQIPALPTLSFGPIVPVGTRPGKMCATCSYWRGPMLLEDGSRVGECEQEPGTTQLAPHVCDKYQRCSRAEIDRRAEAAPTAAALVVADDREPAPPQKLTPHGRDQLLKALERAKRVRGAEE
jgi:hypothetical protein